MAQKSEYPVRFLYQAYNTLKVQGWDAFRRFVVRVDMPTEDIERVTNKYNYDYDPEFKKKIDAKIARIKRRLDLFAGKTQRNGTGFKNYFPN